MIDDGTEYPIQLVDGSAGILLESEFTNAWARMLHRGITAYAHNSSPAWRRISNPKVMLDLDDIVSSFGATVSAVTVNSATIRVSYKWGLSVANAELYFQDSGRVTISAGFVTESNGEYAQLLEWHTSSSIDTSASSGRVSILTQGNGGIYTKDLGFASIPLSEQNYRPEDITNIRTTIEELTIPFPSGRLTIVDGPPGVGKTFLLRAIVHEVPNAQFIFIPPSMVQSLGDPSLSTALLDLQSDSEETAPIVLICEDADSILVSRGADNMASVASMLNLTSGILGELLDIRVLATTNAKTSSIDPAFQRDGRLSTHLKIRPLCLAQATGLLESLVQDDHMTTAMYEDLLKDKIVNKSTSSMGFNNDVDYETEGVILATVYKTARDLGWTPTAVEEGGAKATDAVEIPEFITKLLPKTDSFLGGVRTLGRTNNMRARGKMNLTPMKFV